MGNTIHGESLGDQSGESVALSSDGTIVAIGAIRNDDAGDLAGHVRVYQYDSTSTSWQQLGDDIDGENANDQSGMSVDLSSNGLIVAIGAKEGAANSAGQVRVYQYDSTSTSWQQLGDDIDGENAGDENGMSVALSSNGLIVAIGAPGNDGVANNAGHTRVYEYDSTSASWQQLGDDIDGENVNDRFGSSVALSSDGTIVAIGASRNDGVANNAGHTRVYEYDSTSASWQQLGDDIDGENVNDHFGSSVALSSDGTIVAVSAIFGGAAMFAGHVRVYEYDSTSTSWQQIGDDIDGENAGDSSGTSVALSSDGNTVAIGAYENDDAFNNAGHARVYTYDPLSTSWQQLGDDIDGENVNDRAGSSVALSSDGTIVAIGALEIGLMYSYTDNSKEGTVRMYTCSLPSSSVSPSPSPSPPLSLAD